MPPKTWRPERSERFSVVEKGVGRRTSWHSIQQLRNAVNSKLVSNSNSSLLVWISSAKTVDLDSAPKCDGCVNAATWHRKIKWNRNQFSKDRKPSRFTFGANHSGLDCVGWMMFCFFCVPARYWFQFVPYSCLYFFKDSRTESLMSLIDVS